MKIQPYKHYNNFYILPTLFVTYETHYLSIDMIWGKWGLSILLKDK